MTTGITIYGLTNEHGQICYVGQTISPTIRFSTHQRRNHGFTVCGMAVLQTFSSRTKANIAEREWIRFFGRDNLFNRLDGGGCTRRIGELKVHLGAQVRKSVKTKFQAFVGRERIFNEMVEIALVEKMKRTKR